MSQLTNDPVPPDAPSDAEQLLIILVESYTALHHGVTMQRFDACTVVASQLQSAIRAQAAENAQLRSANEMLAAGITVRPATDEEQSSVFENLLAENAQLREQLRTARRKAFDDILNNLTGEEVQAEYRALKEEK